MSATNRSSSVGTGKNPSRTGLSLAGRSFFELLDIGSVVEFKISYSMIGRLGKAHSVQPVLLKQAAAAGNYIAVGPPMCGIITGDAEIRTVFYPHQSNDKGNQLAIEESQPNPEIGVIVQDDFKFPPGHALNMNTWTIVESLTITRIQAYTTGQKPGRNRA